MAFCTLETARWPLLGTSDPLLSTCVHYEGRDPSKSGEKPCGERLRSLMTGVSPCLIAGSAYGHGRSARLFFFSPCGFSLLGALYFHRDTFTEKNTFAV